MPKQSKIAGLSVPKGRFYGPCSGRDLPLAFELFGDVIDRFTFCDLAYQGPRVTAREAVPTEWRLVSRVQGIDEASGEKAAWYSGNRPFRPRVTIETWRRPDGSEAQVELRCDLAQDVLTAHFAPASIAAFMHINDGTGEGGSDLWFLASPNREGGEASRGQRLLPETLERLCHGAIVVTDGVLADDAFRSEMPFSIVGARWELVSRLPNARRQDRRIAVWRYLDMTIV